MPEKRGRKRRARDRERDRGPRDGDAPAAVSPAPVETRPPRPKAAAGDVPSNTARASGFAIAVVTVFLAILTFADGASAGGGEAVVRMALGVFLVLLGAVVGVLSLFPAQVRRMIRGE